MSSIIYIYSKIFNSFNTTCVHCTMVGFYPCFNNLSFMMIPGNSSNPILWSGFESGRVTIDLHTTINCFCAVFTLFSFGNWTGRFVCPTLDNSLFQIKLLRAFTSSHHTMTLSSTLSLCVLRINSNYSATLALWVIFKFRLTLLQQAWANTHIEVNNARMFPEIRTI